MEAAVNRATSLEAEAWRILETSRSLKFDSGYGPAGHRELNAASDHNYVTSKPVFYSIVLSTSTLFISDQRS